MIEFEYLTQNDLRLFGTANAPGTSSGLKGHKSPAQFGEETRRRESVSDGTIVAVADAAQIGGQAIPDG